MEICTCSKFYDFHTHKSSRQPCTVGIGNMTSSMTFLCKTKQHKAMYMYIAICTSLVVVSILTGALLTVVSVTWRYSQVSSHQSYTYTSAVTVFFCLFYIIYQCTFSGSWTLEFVLSDWRSWLPIIRWGRGLLLGRFNLYRGRWSSLWLYWSAGTGLRERQRKR